MRGERFATSIAMESGFPSKFSLTACYSKAWKAFAKWWIPICLIAGLLMVFQLGPKQLAKAESSAVIQTCIQLFTAIGQEDWVQAEELSFALNETLFAYAKTVMKFTLYATPLIAILTIVLLCTSVMAIKDQRIRYSPWRILWVAFLNFLMAFAKVLLLFLFFPLGIYLYIKLYFVSLAMVEERKGLSGAVKRSWEISTGNFWPLLGMVTINGAIQMTMVPTLIGLIPATGFATTARTAAFEMLRKERTSACNAIEETLTADTLASRI